MMARARGRLVLATSGAFWERLRRFERKPVPGAQVLFALFPRAMPAANSGASSPLSVTATDGVWMADRIGDETYTRAPVPDARGFKQPRRRPWARDEQVGPDCDTRTSVSKRVVYETRRVNSRR